MLHTHKLPAAAGTTLLVFALSGCASLQEAWGTRGMASDVPPHEMSMEQRHANQQYQNSGRYYGPTQAPGSGQYHSRTAPSDGGNLGYTIEEEQTYQGSGVRKAPPSSYGTYNNNANDMTSFEKEVLTRPSD
jgi:hypothetical protein